MNLKIISLSQWLRLTLSFILFLSTVSSFAFVVDGIAYEITSEDNKTVELRSGRSATDLVIPEMVEYNGEQYSVTSIHQNAFSGSNNLVSITIPSTVTRIKPESFKSCWNLTSVSMPNTITYIGKKAFFYCQNLSNITLSTSLTYIEDSVFMHCFNLNAVSIPYGVTAIGKSAFCNSKLTSVELPSSLKIIEASAFSSCNLKVLTIPNSVSRIEERAFAFSSIRTIIIPNSVTYIGKGAFEGNLKSNPPYLTIISEIETPYDISEDVFDENQYAVANLIVPDGKKTYYMSIPNWNKFQSIVEKSEEANTPRKQNIHIAEAGTLENCISGEKYLIEELTISGELDGRDFRLLREMAGNNYTGGMTPGSLNYLDLSDVTLKVSDELIQNAEFIVWLRGSVATNPQIYGFCEIQDSSIFPPFTFCGCTSLHTVLLPNNIKEICEGAFCGCEYLETIDVPNSVVSIEGIVFNGTPWFDNQPDGLVYAGKVLYKYKGKMPDGTNIELSEGTLGISPAAFSGCSGLTSVTIPNSVASIGNSAFRNCSGLNSIMVKSGNTKYDSRNNCNAIIETASNNLISGCKNTIIPNSVTSIGVAAFYGCSGLTSITIPNSVTFIGNVAFSGCSGLASVTIPNSVTSIGYSVFSGCSGLTSVTIPNSVTSIGSYAFNSCSGLTSVTIPNSVTSIGSYAFNSCSGLTEVKSMIDTPFAINPNCWREVNTDNIPLYVPRGTKALYETTDGWNVFKNIIEMDSDDNLNPVDGNGGVNFGGDDNIDNNTNLNGNVVGNIYYNISDENGEYSSTEGCIILRKSTSDSDMNDLVGKDIFGEDFKNGFTGIVFMVRAGSGTIKVNAQTVGSMTLKVKIGNSQPFTMELEGKIKASFPYTVTEPTYVYIYGGSTSSNAPFANRTRSSENALKIYGIEWSGESTSIESINRDVETNVVIYNMSGQRIERPSKGIYIKNGKKVIFK